MNQKMSIELSAEVQALMACADTFEQADSATQVDLRSFLGKVPKEQRSAALVELVMVDFELRWKRGQRRQIHQYLEEYPELRESETAVAQLLHAESDFCRRVGERPAALEHRAMDQPTPRDTGRGTLETAAYGDSIALPAGAPPKRISKYTIVRELGSGGFGVVYQGYDEQLERYVAIKVSSHGTPGRTGLSDDLLHEARSISRLDHVGIVKLIEVGETDEGVGYVVYEYIAGETLTTRINLRKYDHAQAAEWIARVAEALHYAHKHDVIHRDIKPANILIDAASQPKVVDFGLARRDSRFFFDDAGKVMGTAAYLSPEQAKGTSHWASSQSDIYSLGVVLYELICGRRPFDSTNVQEMLEQVKLRTPPPPRSIDDTIPKALEDVCLKALSKEPGLRYKNGAEMAADLRASVRPHTSLPTTLLRTAASLIAMVALCVLVFSALRAYLPSAQPPAPAPVFSSFDARMVREQQGGMPVLSDEHLPLSSKDRLMVQATFDRPAYGYLMMYEQDGKARLLWPARDALKDQHPADRIIYPPLSSASEGLSVPDADGATLMIALASQNALTESEISELLATQLTLSVSAADAATATNRWLVAYPAPKFNDHAVLRDGSRSLTEKLRVSDAFKQKLGAKADAYYGLIVSHRKQTP